MDAAPRFQSQRGRPPRHFEKRDAMSSNAFRTVMLICSITAVAAAASRAAELPSPTTMRVVKVKVWKHPYVFLNNSEARRILTDMGRVLQDSDGPSDVATSIRFELDGTVQELPEELPYVIQTEQD